MPMYSLAASISLLVVLVVVLILAVWFDVIEKRIPNWITIGGMLGSLALRWAIGPEALWAGVVGGALGLTLGVFLFAAGAMGAGDGKFLATIGSLLGLAAFLRCLPLIGAFGGLLVLAVTACQGTMIPTLLRFRELVFYFVSFGRIGDRRTLSTPGAVTVPYGVAVAAGAAMACVGWGLTI